MAINYELINKGGISLGTNFELLSEKPLDSRLVVPSLDGLQNYIDSAAAYEGMIAYVSSEKKHYEVKTIDGVLSYRQFGLTNDELNDMITNATTAAMEFKGATATLPSNPAKGDMYKVAGQNINITIDGVAAKVGDAIVYNGTEWFLIPSGDDIEDTWRPVKGEDGTEVTTDASLTFAAGDKLDAAVAANGTITYSHEEIAAPELLAENEKTRTYITELVADGFGHITGYKTATENVEDSNTTYEFECQVEEGHSNVHFSVKASDAENAKEVCLDAYTRNETDNKIKTAIEALDVNDISGFGAGKTLATLTETDGKIAATFQDIAITESQITDLGDYKTKQTAYSEAGTNKQTITAVSQNANGEIAVTYSDIDFSHDHDAQYKKLQTVINGAATDKNVFIEKVSQNAQGVISVETKAVDFSDYYTKTEAENKFVETVELESKTAGKVNLKVDGVAAAEVEINGFADKLDVNTFNTYVETRGATDEELKNAVVGTENDAKTANTIYGAKKHATELDAAMDLRVDAIEAKVDGWDTVQADAVRSVEGAKNSGIKATRSDAAVTLNFDEDCVFIFNCGTSV